MICSNRMRKDRSSSAAGLLEYSSSSSPDAVRRNKEKLTAQNSSAKLRSTPHNTLVDLTIFHIPGMDVKLQYQSKVLLQYKMFLGVALWTFLRSL